MVLSLRERQVLHHVSNGLTYLQTAHRMGITTSTVDTYLRRIRAKAGLFSGAELTRLAVALEVGESVEPDGHERRLAEPDRADARRKSGSAHGGRIDPAEQSRVQAGDEDPVARPGQPTGRVGDAL